MTNRLPGARRARLALVLLALAGLGWGGFEALLHTDWLLERVRAALVRELSLATGGSVCLAALQFGDSRLSIEIEGLQIEGLGPAGSPPLLTVPRATAIVGWRTLLGGGAYLEELRIHGPVVRAAFGEAGDSNLPRPSGPGQPGVIAIRRLEVLGGQVVWNGRPYGMALSGSGLEIVATLDESARAYRVDARISDAQWSGEGLRPLQGATGSLRAVADSQGVEIQEASLRGSEFSLEASGRLRNLQSPRFEGRWRAAAVLPALAALWHLEAPGLAGLARLEGDLEWDLTAGQASYRAKAAATGIEVAGLDLQADLEADLTGDSEGVELTGISGSALGGLVAGRARLRGPWDAPSLEATATSTGVSLRDLAHLAGIEAIPWGGTLDTRAEVAGSLSQGLAVDLGFSIHPAAAPARLPLAGGGSLRFLTHDGSVSVSGVKLTARDASLAVAGTVDAELRAHLEVVASMDSRQAVETILGSVRPTAALPVALPDARYSFRGTLRGGLSGATDAVLEGDVSAEDILLGGESWERFSMRGSLSPAGLEILDGRLTDSGGWISVRGTLPFDTDREMDLAVSARSVESAKLARSAGFDLPVSGASAIEAQMSGSLARPVAAATISVEAPRVLGESLDMLEAELQYAAGKLQLAQAAFRRGESVLRATGSIARESREFELDIASNFWTLDKFAWPGSRVPGVAGNLQFEVAAAGQLGSGNRLDSLEIDGSWELSELRRGDLSLGHWSGVARSMRDRPNVDFEWSANTLGGVVRGDASVWPGEPSAYRGKLDFSDISIPRAAALADLPVFKSEGVLTGRADFSGEAGDIATFEMDGIIERAELRLAAAEGPAVRITNIFPMHWGVKEGALRFDSMNLAGPDTDFAIDGSVEFGGQRNLDVGLDGTLNLALLNGFLQGVAADGAARVRLRMLGTLDNPSLEGSVAFVDASARGLGLPLRLTAINGSVSFADGQGRIERLTAASGGGTFRVDGVVALRGSRLEYRFDATAEDMRVDYPKSVSSVVDGRFTLAGVGSTSILNGDLLISRLSLAENLSFADLFADLQQPEGVPVAASMLQGMQVNVRIGAVSQLPVETELARNVAADLDLNVMGTMAAPSILGEIGIAQGELNMLGTRYRINRGDIRFVNPLKPEPVLNVELEARIRDVDLALVLSGPAGALDLSYRSDPPLPFHDLVSLVAVGKEPTFDPTLATRRRIEQQSVVQTGADALLSQALARPMSRRMQRFFGVSRLKVDPQVGGLEANPSARISTEQQIADDLTLIYSYDLSSAQQQAIRIEWNPDRRWSFVVTRDQNGLVGSDILYRVRLP